jgi:dipeptidyl aminopeptidase/acylaminoacyl peptidase
MAMGALGRAAWSVVAGASLWWSGPAAAEPLSAEDLLAAPALLDIDLSPDGRRIAAIVRLPDDEGYGLAIFSSDAGSAPSVQKISSVTPIWVYWATDDRLLVATVSELVITRTRISYPSARIVAFNADGSDPVMLFDNQRRVTRSSMNLARITSFLPNDPDHVLMPGYRGGDLDLWRVNIRNGDAERVALGAPGTFSWFADRDGRPMIRLDSNVAGTVITAYAPSEEREGRWRRVARVREEDRLEFQPLAPAEEPGSFYTAARPDGEDRAGIYVYDAVSNEFLRQVAADPRVDVEGVIADGATGAFAGYVYIDDRVEYRFQDDLVQRHFDAVREFLGPDVNVRIYDRSADGRTWIVEARGPREPGAFYIYDLDATFMEAVYAVAGATARESYAPMQALRYRARDGLEITGYLSLPPDRAAEDLPLVMMPHGGPEARDLMTFDVWVQYLASRGYAVFQPNFRGSSGYGRSFAEAGLRQWGAAMQNDLTDGVRHLADLGIVDPERVCIFGASYGGYAALAGAALSPDIYRCAISTNGVSDPRGFMRHIRRGDLFDDDDYDYWVSQLGDLRENQDLLRAASPLEHVENIQIPILLIHAVRDALVPVEQSRDMAEALADAGKPHRLVEVPDVGHSNWPHEETTAMLAEVAAFLDEHLPAE